MMGGKYRGSKILSPKNYSNVNVNIEANVDITEDKNSI